MAFQKGQPRPANAGKKKGSVHNISRKKVSQILAEKNKEPVEEIMRLMPMLEPRDQAKLWLDLLSYCQAKPTVYESDDNTDPNNDLVEKFKHVTDATLISIAGGKKEKA
ncbi:MAG: hypothetical protein ACXVB1_08925 [Pseudobdellovibrionaceae bacterium]